MKFTIDTTRKEITLESEVKLSELTKELENLLGENYSLYKIVPKPEKINLNEFSPYVPTYPQPQPLIYPNEPYSPTFYGNNSLSC